MRLLLLTAPNTPRRSSHLHSTHLPPKKSQGPAPQRGGTAWAPTHVPREEPEHPLCTQSIPMRPVPGLTFAGEHRGPPSCSTSWHHLAVPAPRAAGRLQGTAGCPPPARGGRRGRAAAVSESWQEEGRHARSGATRGWGLWAPRVWGYSPQEGAPTPLEAPAAAQPQRRSSSAPAALCAEVCITPKAEVMANLVPGLPDSPPAGMLWAQTGWWEAVMGHGGSSAP